jgi:hypothetical protein
VYVWADGVYLQARMEDNAECMLVLIGATPEGKNRREFARCGPFAPFLESGMHLTLG